MISLKRIYVVEFAVIILLWTTVILSPILLKDSLDEDWRAIHLLWSECAVVAVAFLIHRVVMMPRLFFKRRYIRYTLSLGALIGAIALFTICFDGINSLMSLFGSGELESHMPPVASEMIYRGHHPPMPHHLSMPPAEQLMPPAIWLVIVVMIVLALDLGLRIAVKWIITQQSETLAHKELLAAQLEKLQAQVSPHFFMNTLNNIHALVDIDSERAKQTIIELSQMMTYLLYDSSNKEWVMLQRELDFISSYIKLMKLRFSKQVDVRFSHSTHVPDTLVPPLIFLNLIENAFNDDSILMTIMNTNHADKIKSKPHGLGIANVRKRLDLIYGESCSLDITDMDDIFLVELTLPHR